MGFATQAHAAVITSSNATGNWSADNTWRVTKQDGTNTSTSSGTAGSLTGNVFTPSAVSNWVTSALVGHRLLLNTTWYTITANDTTTVTVSGSPSYTTGQAWAVGGQPLKTEFPSIGAHTITIDCNIGASGAGNGIGNISLTSATSVLNVNTSAARTIYFNSSASTALAQTGSTGTNRVPSSDATFNGFLISPLSTVNLSGTAANPVTITTADDTNYWYYQSMVGTLASPDNGNQSVTFSYCYLNHLGANVTYATGIVYSPYLPTVSLGITLTNCKVNDYYNAVWYGSSGVVHQVITNNIFTGGRGNTIVPNVAYNDVITDNTETGAVATGYFFFEIYEPTNITFARNVVNNGTYSRGVAHAGGAGPGTAGNTYDSCLLKLPDSLAGQSNSRLFDIGSQAYHDIMENSIAWGVIYGARIGGPGSTPEVAGNYFRTNSLSAEGQGMIFNGGVGQISAHNNIIVIDNSANNFGIFPYNNVGMYIDHNTIVNLTPANTAYGIFLGEGSDSANHIKVRSNLISNCTYGLKEGVGTNIYDIDTPPAAGVHHNNVYGATTPYGRFGGSITGTGFDDGTNEHPNAVYGDLAVDPQFVDTTRTIASWDTSLGGPGTEANVWDQFSRRSGWGGTYDSNYTVANLLAYLQNGFKVKNASLNNAGHDGVTIGAMDYVSSDATVTSFTYTVSALVGGAGTIINIPYGTSKAVFEAALAKGDSNSTWNDTGIHDPVVSGDTLVVTAQDTVTTGTYTITVNPAPGGGPVGPVVTIDPYLASSMFSFNINNNQPATTTSQTTLYLNSLMPYASNMMVSNYEDFRDGVIQQYSPIVPWDICKGRESVCNSQTNPTLPVYVKFMDSRNYTIYQTSYSITYSNSSTPNTTSTAAPSTTTTSKPYVFIKNLKIYDISEDVRTLQKYLNSNGFKVSDKGPGSPGKETNYFGTLTFKAVVKLQEQYKSQILAPSNLKKGTGYFGPSTRSFINSLVK